MKWICSLVSFPPRHGFIFYYEDHTCEKSTSQVEEKLCFTQVINMKISVKQVFIKIDQLSQINKNKLICYEIKGRLLAKDILQENK